MSDGVLRAVDRSKTAVEVGVPSWVPRESGPALPRPAEATVAGEALRLEFPPSLVVVTDQETDQTRELGSGQGPLDLAAGSYVMKVEAPVKIYVRFDGPATVSRPGHEKVLLSLADQQPVTLGFQSHVESPLGTVVVPQTPDGVATALTHLAAGHRSATPDRSFPSMRSHPPLVAFGEEHVPDDVIAAREETGIDLTLPADLSYLFPAAPLAYYLGAEVAVEPDAHPTLRFGDRRLELPTGRGFEREVAALLRRTFWLDCLVRNAGPYGRDLLELDALDTLDLDATDLYDARLDERLATYLDADFETVADVFPEWHLSMYVAPSYEHLTSFPFFVNYVPQVFQPRADPLEGQERLNRTLGDFYRRTDDVPSVDLLSPELGPGRYHGWLADGIPIDVFKVVPQAYENRSYYRDRADEAISIVAILNDAEMGEEHTEAARIYRERAEHLDLDIDIRERVSVAELARIFETDHDHVHYIGHCEADGLRCADGNLSISSLSRSRAQTFFLNACGSYYEGVELVKKGSVAGAVTFDRVLDKQAARVGTMFARLISHGYSIERALDLSRRRIIMGKDYAAVGDGTHVLTQTDNLIGPEATLERATDGDYQLTYSMHSSWAWGSNMQVYLEKVDKMSLVGSKREFTLDRQTLAEYLSRGELPVIYQGDIHWSAELARELEET